MKVTMLTVVCVVALMLGLGLGCPAGKRLAFDLKTTLEENKRLNKRLFDCPNPEPGIPCFYYKDSFSPFFLIEDTDSGGSERFLGSYTFKVVGGGPEKKEIRNFTEEEIIMLNRHTYSENGYTSLVWTIEDMTDSVSLSAEGNVIINVTSRLRWRCRENSPCRHVQFRGLLDPDFFFIMEVSNKGTDSSTDCEFTTRFELHLYGLPLDPVQVCFFMLLSFAILLFLVACYIIYNCCMLIVKDGWTLRSIVSCMYISFSNITKKPMFDRLCKLLVVLDLTLMTTKAFTDATVMRSGVLSTVSAILLSVVVMVTAIKILVSGLSYFKEFWNVIDVIIVIRGLVDVQLTIVESEGGFNSSQVSLVLKVIKALSAIRALRLLRVICFFKCLRDILSTCGQTLRCIGPIIGLMLLPLLLFTVIFRETFNESDPERFGTLFRTFCTLFQVLTLDDWSLIYMTSRDKGEPQIIVFLIAFIMVEYFVFLNLFVAALEHSFSEFLNKKMDDEQSTAVKDGKIHPTQETAEAEVSRPETEEAFTGTKGTTRKSKLTARYLQLLDTMEEYQQKYRSQARVHDRLVQTFFKDKED